ncbi:hypothetical protein CDV55_106064 [Aspergillus turcosus]|nr:hypothetical protein CDV55_106064 [Aspergillus turcosus]
MLSMRTFKFIFHHVILPPKLPQDDDDEEIEIERNLHEFVQGAIEGFAAKSPPESREIWATAINMLHTWIEVDRQGAPCKDTLARVISNLRKHGAMALYIRAQNCGWVAYYDGARQRLIFDAFEVSPRSADVLSAQGSLLRRFPGQSVAISAEKMDDWGFCSGLANDISRLCTETVSEMIPTTTKAKVPVPEKRDTTHPGLVTEGLMTQLLAFGERNGWTSFDKHMRDEVNWRSSRLPWRRSPYWFVMRVALQTVLRRAFPEGKGQDQYKNFMLYLVTEIGLVATRKRPAVPADHLEIIRAKIGRRISKLQGAVFPFVAEYALSAETALKTALEGIQRTIIDTDSITVPELFSYTRQDLRMTLENCSEYLQAAMNGVPMEVETSPFNRTYEIRGQRDSNGVPMLRSNDVLSLFDFERWVENEMTNWAGIVQPSEHRCCILAERFGQYYEYGSPIYDGNPEAMSIMILTMLEVWVTLDQMCCIMCPLLREYSPEIPVKFLEPLLLPQRCQMRRAGRIEAYIESRHHGRVPSSPDILRDPAPHSFAISYYDSSQEHQRLREQIEQHAHAELEEKRREWKEKSSQYDSILHEARQLGHEWELNKRGRYYHVSYCRRCSLENQAHSINIDVYEWPLPQSDDDWKSVIFELRCPHWFASWRDVTWKLVQDLGRPKMRTASHMEQNLLKYSETKRFAINWGQHLTLGSSTKSWLRSHYKSRDFPVDFKDITPPNAFRFKLLDSRGNGWVTDQEEYPTVKPLCTFSLPHSPYSSLQYALNHFRHTENQIIADQRNCHPKLSLHEFIAFGCLRAGERVQWYNMIRELASSTLSMNNESVCILFRQAAWELGTSSGKTDLREAHRVFEDTAFSDRLLETLECRLDSIEANWDEHHTLQMLVIIGLRALRLSVRDTAVERAAEFLRRCRKVTMRWIRDLVINLDSQTGTQSQAQQLLLKRVGGICQLTYSVESQYLSVLLRSPEDLFHLVRSSIIVFENTTPESKSSPAEAKAAWVQTSRILHRTEEHTRRLILQDASGLNDAIEESVQTLVVTSPWTFGQGSLTRWATSQTTSDALRQEQQVHYDLLTGELLVDNCPPGRLPENYQKDPLFQTVFGSRTITVVPSSLNGCRFTSACRFGDYQVHFGIEENQLIVNAQRGSQLLRLIPHDWLKGDFPDSLISQHAHWLDLENGTVEFRPLERAWEPCSSNWRLSLNHAVAKPAVMERDGCTMVDVRSQLYRKLAEVLTVLDTPQYMIVFLTSDGTIKIEMVRVDLTFLINTDGALESPKLNATVDRNQDIGCFYGLKNKLVLQDTGEQRHRSVLIPYGEVQLWKDRHHTVVSVESGEESRVTCFRYSLDPHLQVLRGTVDMLSTLYQAYMHALTSFVLPESATRRSGTAEALRILRQAGLRSPIPLEKECVRLLGRLAALTPRRQYYPSHLQSMQTTEWSSDLGELAQHDEFRVLVREIVDHARSFSKLHTVSEKDEQAAVKCYQNRGDQHLLERARLRHAQFRCSGFDGGAVRPTPQPSQYSARDCDSGSHRSRRVYEVATVLREWPRYVPHCSDLYTMVAGWEYVRPSKVPVRDFTCTELLQLSIRDAWGALYELCQSSDRAQDSYSLMSLFCMIAFEGEEKLNIIRPLLAVAFSGRFEDLPVPGFGEQGRILPLQKGQFLVSSEISEAVQTHYVPFSNPPNVGILTKAQNKELEERRTIYDFQRRNAVSQCLNAVIDQWPCERPWLPEVPGINRPRASEACTLLCTQWYQNREFLTFLRQVQDRLNAIEPGTARADESMPPVLSHPSLAAKSSFCPPSLLDMLRSREPPPVSPLKPPLKFCRPRIPQRDSTGNTSKLRALILGLRDEPNPYRRQLGDDLQESLEALEKSELPCPPTSLPVGRDVLERSCRDLEQQRDGLWAAIHRALTTTNGTPEAVASAVLWPEISIFSTLSLLTADRWQLVPDRWRNVLLAFAQSISSLRRCERLLACCDRRDLDGFFKEAETLGCEGWEAATCPEWLLLEIESNMTIRALQAEVAQRMIRPDPSGNSVLQLNMGEGKTSMIIPMIMLLAADGSQVPRNVVLKALLRQSLNILTQRLGGILGRAVYYIPFSRDTPCDEEMVTKLAELYEECQKRRGVLIALPEQILSFRLIGLDLIGRKPALARKVMALEMWLQNNCRNIIDESDEILDPKFQLVYTIGSQQTLDGHSDRWHITQSLLTLVEQQARRLHDRDPTCLDIEYHGSRYPILRFLKAGAADTLIHMVLLSINDQGLPGLPLHLWSRRIRQSAFNFIRFVDTTPRDDRALRENFERGNSLRKLLVLRGLFAHRVLWFALAGKRWLVDYGLHPRRCLMAVPFRAKGIPSEHAEFGHPDVAITLTCLSYYYDGLSCEQVRHCFGLLAKENDPAAEYQLWISRNLSGLPAELRAITGVNLEDTRTFHKILYPHIQYQKGLVDFYLSRVVFPKEAKEFPHKLCTSAWDLPSRPNQPSTTGFSGTNDNRFLLPRSAPQRDLPQLLHTNAMVLSLLLREENQQCILAQDEGGRQLRAEQLLDLISSHDPPVRVIIDVGAQILELSNRSIAQLWLSLPRSRDVEAAIFFDEHDEAVVVDREGHVEKLISSAFRQRMGMCLVFLDQHHSRGVDLKLPMHYRAAVTLGPRLTKDRLVQACNRMRGLGNGQSLLFVIPPEVSHSMGSQGNPVTSLSVVQWALKQTCDIFESLGPLWALQGLHYHRRVGVWDRLLQESVTPQEAIQHIQEPEAQTLSELYAPWDGPRVSPLDGHLNQDDIIIQELLRVWRGSGQGSRRGAQLHEEQERQISHEVQREQQVCRPPGIPPAPHHLHEDVRYFATNGRFSRDCSSAVRPAFETFRQTLAGRFDFLVSLAPNLDATEDFIRTVKETADISNDEFLKPVHWVLSNTYNSRLLLLSQYEANELMREIQDSQKTQLHIYTPRTTKTMRPFERLDFLTVSIGHVVHRCPRDTVQDLGLFAGSLYFESFSIYESFRHFLGLVTNRYRDVPEDRVTSEGFVDPETRQSIGWPVQSPFRSCPLPFLGAILDIRSKGHGYLQTHMGKLLEGLPLAADHF